MSKIWNPKASDVTPEEFAIIEAEERLVYETQKAVRMLLRARNRTAADLAEALQVSPARISQMMSGNANLTLRTIARIYHVLGTSASVCEAPVAEAEEEDATQTAVDSAELQLPVMARECVEIGSWTGIAPNDDIAIAAEAGYGARAVWIVGEFGEPTIQPPAHIRRRRYSPSATLAKLPAYEPVQKVLINA